MLKTIKYQVRGFVIGVFVTILVIGCMHYRIDFRIDQDAQELQQTEKLDQQAKAELSKFKKVQTHETH